MGTENQSNPFKIAVFYSLSIFGFVLFFDSVIVVCIGLNWA